MKTLLNDLGVLHKTQIFATDIHPYQLQEAKSGIYPIEKLAEERRNHIASGSQGNLENGLTLGKYSLKVAPRLRKQVLFYPHSLAHEGPFNEFELILCPLPAVKKPTAAAAKTCRDVPRPHFSPA